MVNIKQIRSDVAGPILYQGADRIIRSLNLYYNDVSGFISVNSTKIGTTGTESYVSGDAGTLKLKNLSNHYIDIQNNIIKYSAADHRILGKLYLGGDVVPTANLHIGAGSTTTSAIRLSSGPLTTGGNILAGNLEFLTDRLYFTQTTSLTRQTIAYLSDLTTATIIIPNTQVVFGTGTGVTSNDGFTHVGNGLAVPGANNYIVIGYLKLGYDNVTGIGIDGSAFGVMTIRNNQSIFTIDRVSDVWGHYKFELSGTEVLRIKHNNLVLKNALAIDFGENINGPPRIEAVSDMYISSSNNGTSTIIFRPSYIQTFTLSTTLATLQTNLRLSDISSNGVIKTYFQAFSGEKGLVSYNNGAGTYTGSSISLNLSLQLYNVTNDNSAMDIIVSTRENGAIYNLPTIISTEYGTRLDKIGLRIDKLSTLHTENVYPFSVNNALRLSTSNTTTNLQLVNPTSLASNWSLDFQNDADANYILNSHLGGLYVDSSIGTINFRTYTAQNISFYTGGNTSGYEKFRIAGHSNTGQFPIIIGEAYSTSGAKITYNGKDKIIFADETGGGTFINSTGTNSSVQLSVNGITRLALNDSGNSQILGGGELIIAHDGGVNIPRTTIGHSLTVSNNAYNLGGRSPIHVTDGSGSSFGLGYGGGGTNFFMYGGAAGLYIRGTAAGPSTYGVFIELSGIVANGKSRIGDANFNTGHTLEIAGDLQVIDQAGTGSRIVESDSSGVQSASKLLINDWISDTVTRNLLEDTANWDVLGVYIGTAITNTFQSQKHYDDSYLFICVDNDEWIRIPRM